MKAVGRIGIVVAIAATSLVVAGIAVVRTPAGRDDGDAAAFSASALLRPGVGALDDPIDRLQQRLRELPEDWRGYASLGLAYVAKARVTADPTYYPKAEGALQRSLHLNERDNVNAVLGLGALALARHDFAAALQHGRRARAMAPYSMDAYGVIGDSLVELGRYRAAFHAIQRMVDTKPALASYARVSYARELTGDVDAAVRAMRLAFDAAGTPTDAAWAAHRLGELAWGSGDVRTAAGWFRRARDLDPNGVNALAGLAKVAWARGRPAIAIERYTEVVERFPSPEHLIALGDLYATTGRPELAEQQYAVVRATAELAAANGVNVDLELALFLADHGEPEAALTAAEAEWERRRSVHVADTYAWALFRNGRFDEAAGASNRALSLGTHDALFLFHAATIRHGLGDDDAALALIAEALQRNPNFSILHRRAAEDLLTELKASR
ncbi:MAG TPA: tetratricopeptide repeat protein [Actinomycetota bacterium]|jgi:tetratricopeptide (TPR) repeat protein|nr:tetratricopeptide repeat protein [Actinomycetota bacterium]